MDLAALADFVLVASNGGFAQASRNGRRPKASLSRKVMELEASLGVRLLERGPRSIRLTEEGEILLARAAGPLSEVAAVATELRERRTRPHGRLRVSVPLVFGQMLMGRLAAEFAEAYPAVSLDIAVEDRPVDVVAEGYDVVIRRNPEPDARLTGLCFAKDSLVIVAAPTIPNPITAPDGVEAEPVPVVARRDWRPGVAWRLPEGDGRIIRTRTVLELPSLPMVRDAAITGIGAAELPSVLVADAVAAGRLVCWGVASRDTEELWALHPSIDCPAAKLKAFLQFLDGAFAGESLADRTCGAFR